jgi:hypothetical protein
MYPRRRRHPHAAALNFAGGVTVRRSGFNSAAMLIAFAAIVPAVLVIVAMMITIIVALVIAGARNDAG